MHAVQLPEQLYSEIRRRAKDAGFTTVDEYVATVLADDLQQPAENLDYVFTPERLAHLDRISEAIDAGAPTISAAAVREHFQK